MSTEALTVLVNTMLGQAQECFYRKAQLGTRRITGRALWEKMRGNEPL
jgi:hypothetical protein